MLAWLLAALAGAAPGCELTPADGSRLAGDGVELAWRVADVAAIPLSRPFELLVRACPADVELLKVDARMPAHRHGMNYRPSIVALGDGRWRVTGLLFHMAGDWQLRLDLQHAGRSQLLTQDVHLP
jgi:hypothetical protein